jgi:hypothetical protein
MRLLFATLCLVFFALAAAPLCSLLLQRSDIWWTPRAMLVPLAKSADRVEIYARGEPLAELIRAGQVRIDDAGGSSPLDMASIGLRFNNWDRVRVERLPSLLLYAATCGVAGCVFLLVITGRLAYRNERDRPDHG